MAFVIVKTVRTLLAAHRRRPGRDPRRAVGDMAFVIVKTVRRLLAVRAPVTS